MGDFVDLESGVRSRVREVAMRCTRATTHDAIDILVPNSEIINGRVINWTFVATFRRLRVPFGGAFGTPKERLREAAIAAARRVDGGLDDVGHEPTAWLIAYGDSADEYEMVIWVNRKLSTSPASAHARLRWATTAAGTRIGPRPCRRSRAGGSWP